MSFFPSEEADRDDSADRYSQKIVLCGDYAVGKTSLIRRFAENKFDHDYIPSIGLNIVTKDVKIDRTNVKLNIFDTGGQERFEPLRLRYYEGADAVIFVFDLTRASSADGVQKRWVDEVESVLKKGYVRMIFGNKSDLENDFEVSEHAAVQMAERLGGTYYATSALDGSNVQEAFKDLASRLLKKETA
ncbi:MAG: Rab family GTPase [Promethearchaeota archaeon]